ncbi:MAG: UvrD-helicase domain-containing protein [Deltaproteobacteria bacterium]|nr:UvrD-helicase domain-containing protein [Deltaproteobacteria bacterium]
MSKQMTIQSAEDLLREDQQARQRALDTTRSFLVRAPAGSGKTALLTQRMLALLAGRGLPEPHKPKRPEEVTALTFTRKAAEEMRQRLMGALEDAAQPEGPLSPHQALTRELAREVNARDQQLGWGLARNPHRLRALTLDGFGLGLVRQMPLLAGLGAPPGLLDDPQREETLAQAAAKSLEGLEEEGPEGAVFTLLTRGNNRQDTLAGHLAELLKNRDQWLRHLERLHGESGNNGETFRQEMEENYQRLATTQLTRLQALAQDALGEGTGGSREGEREGEERAGAEALFACARFAASHVAETSPIHGLSHLFEWPGTDPQEDGPLWAGLRTLLLTGKDTDGDWRKKGGLNKNVGFPAKDKNHPQFAEMKERMGRVLANLSQGEDAELLAQSLCDTDLLTGPLTEDTWRGLRAAAELLKAAAGHLNQAMASQGVTDFNGMAMGALEALEKQARQPVEGKGGEIRHLLVDEFQDTSLLQARLLESLTAQWTPEDGRTLFLVGDPMQSIYRFREAEVGLFLTAWERQRLGVVPLECLTLRVNFRSGGGIVDWVNRSFQRVFPLASQPETGAVAYAPSTPRPGSAFGPAVFTHWFCSENKTQNLQDEGETAAWLAMEAVAAVARLGKEAPENKDEKVALLVNTRAKAVAVLAALRRRGQPFQGVEMEPLGERPAVQDLAALTRALLHPADRVAWWALARGPWCALTLEGMARLAEGATEWAEVQGRPPTPWELFTSPQGTARLGENDRARLAAFTGRLAPWLARRERLPLRRRVEGAWAALGGAACHQQPEPERHLTEALAFLDLLDDEAGMEPEELEAKLATLYVPPSPQDLAAPLVVMTIHKAKGLEFHTVIVPGLDGKPRGNTQRLLEWAEVPLPDLQEPVLVMAPAPETGGENLHGGMIQKLNQRREEEERKRLVYVACTRPRHTLHLLGKIKATAQGERGAPTGLLKVLAPALEDTLDTPAVLPVDRMEKTRESEQKGEPTLVRLPLGWAPPPPPESLSPSMLPLAETREEEGEKGKKTEEIVTGIPEVPLPYDWAGLAARHVGTVVHRVLEQIARQGVNGWSAERVNARKEWFAHQLRGLGVPEQDLAAAAERVRTALLNTLADPRGQWVLAPHPQAACELALGGMEEGTLLKRVLDRTFVDDQGTRWIVDYKSTAHKGADPAAFAREQTFLRHRPQLEGYARWMAALEPGRAIRMGVYFPLLTQWVEWGLGE